MIQGNPYPGRGILLGQSGDGTCAVSAYFIMGRSENSRNRIFVSGGDGLTIRVFRQEKLTDPSLILYTPLRVLGNRLILTNGDQTDTIYDGLGAGKTFAQALESRRFEPDAPNFTPRISGMVTFAQGGFTYRLSILKAGDPAGETCVRNTFCYEPRPGEGRLIHTYAGDGSPLPAFAGEPEPYALSGGIDEFSRRLWNGLDRNNRVALFVRYTPLDDRLAPEDRIFNKHEGAETR